MRPVYRNRISEVFLTRGMSQLEAMWHGVGNNNWTGKIYRVDIDASKLSSRMVLSYLPVWILGSISDSFIRFFVYRFDWSILWYWLLVPVAVVVLRRRRRAVSRSPTFACQAFHKWMYINQIVDLHGHYVLVLPSTIPWSGKVAKIATYFQIHNQSINHGTVAGLVQPYQRTISE